MLDWIKWVIGLLIVFMIFSYFVSPYSEYKINKAIYKIKEGITSNIEPVIESVPTPSKNECEDLAKKLIPNYIIIRPGTPENYGTYFYDNKWKDNTDFEENNDYAWIREGSNKGEIINYYYLNEAQGFNKFIYSKKIVSGEGEILGTRTFTFSPKGLEEYKTPLFNAEKDLEKRKLIINWSNFNNNLKELLGSDEINLKVISNKESLCNFSLKEEKGQFVCDIPEGYEKIILKTEPDLINTRIFKIVDYNISNCYWVTDYGEVIK